MMSGRSHCPPTHLEQVSLIGDQQRREPVELWFRLWTQQTARGQVAAKVVFSGPVMRLALGAWERQIARKTASKTIALWARTIQFAQVPGEA